MFTFVATLKAQPGKESELAKVCYQLAEETHSREENCLMYIPHVAKDDPTEIIFFEKYTDEQAFKAHCESAHFQAADKKFKDLLVGPAQLNFLPNYNRRSHIAPDVLFYEINFKQITLKANYGNHY